jgi:hypothetical protein
VLWRVSASFELPIITRLDDGTYLSELRGKRKKDRVTVRVIEYSIRDDDGLSEVFALITDLLDPDAAPALELARNYSERWHIELLFRLVKVDLRTPGGILRSRSPQGVRQELWALLCLYQALRTLITRAALIAGLDATRIRFQPQDKDGYLEGASNFFRSTTGLEIKQKVIDGNHPALIVRYSIRSPKGTVGVCDVAEFLTIKNGKLTASSLFFDTKAFGELMQS